MIHTQLVDAAIRSEFERKVASIAAFLSVNPDWLMQVFYAESKLNPQAKNVQEGRLIAAGILQFTTASGFSPSSVLGMTALQQLDLVKQYFTPYRGKMKSYYDVYLVTFFPAAIGKSNSYVLETSRLSAALIAKQNPAVNINKDGKITLAEFKEYVDKTVPLAVRSAVLSPFSLTSFALLAGFIFFLFKTLL
jgi:hypothetical protein